MFLVADGAVDQKPNWRLQVLSAGEISQSVTYQQETGLLLNKKSKGRAKAGQRAGHLTASGYVSVSIRGKQYMAHRLIWTLVHGSWPSGFIDHINGNKSDNRIENLRDVGRDVNQQNVRRPQKNNSTGLLGVVRERNRFVAVIGRDGRSIRIGAYSTADAAHRAYMKAKALLHPGYVPAPGDTAAPFLAVDTQAVEVSRLAEIGYTAYRDNSGDLPPPPSWRVADGDIRLQWMVAISAVLRASRAA